MSDEETIRLAPVRERCGQNERLSERFEWISAPPHVRLHITGTFSQVIRQLVVHGYAFQVEPVTVDVSVLEWFQGAARCE
jgi:outer membrane biogenesis lipoprotein LolB